MELELRVRLSEKPVPPGCGQRGQAAQLLAAARLYFPGQKGPDQPESLSWAPDHVLVLWHSRPPPRVTVLALATCMSTPCRSLVSLICLPSVQPKARPGTELERFLDKQTSSASTEDMQSLGSGAWASLPSAPTPTRPYLDWLFHTLVEEVEGTGPLHPEEKGMPGFAEGGTGEDVGKGQVGAGDGG